MELKTVRQVSMDYNISARMLRYYEQIGLLESRHIDGYAYRVYDEAAVRRLQLIIILRKLQIPVKQIQDILENQDAVTIIEVFKQNISELDEQITALSTVRLILERFIKELQQRANIHLEIDLLNDSTMFAITNALSFSDNKLKESISMEELNRVSETLNKYANDKVRIVYLPPMTMAEIYYNENGITPVKGKAKKEAEAIMKKFIEDIKLYELKPDMRIFGFGDPSQDAFSWLMRVTVPDDMEILPPFTKRTFSGGLFAAHPEWSFDIDKWAEESDKYEWDHRGFGTAEEYFNPFNIYGLNNIDSEITGAMSSEILFPIKEIGKITEEQRNKLILAQTNFERAALHGNSIEVDLTSMITKGNYDLHHENGSLEIKVSDDYKGAGTSQKFKFPLKIELRAKTSSAISINYAEGWIEFNWCYNRGSLFTRDIIAGADGGWFTYKKKGVLPLNEFVDIEWILDKNVMAIKLNGELRYIDDNQQYIKKLKENPMLDLSSEISITCDRADRETVTIIMKSLRITEI